MKRLLVYFLAFSLSLVYVNTQNGSKIDSLKQSHDKDLIPYNSKPIISLNGDQINFENLKNISEKDILSINLIKEVTGVSHGPTLKPDIIVIVTKRKRYYRKLFSNEIPPKN